MDPYGLMCALPPATLAAMTPLETASGGVATCDSLPTCAVSSLDTISSSFTRAASPSDAAFCLLGPTACAAPNWRY